MSARPLPRFHDASFEEVGDQRRADRRKNDRRAGGLRLDPLFAATLVNHVTPPETMIVKGYAAERKIRAGIAFDLRA